MLSDRDRVESILEKLLRLFGGHCFSQNSDLRFSLRRGFAVFMPGFHARRAVGLYAAALG